MADEVAASASKAVRKATVKAFMSPSFNIVKVIPQGIVEIVLRGAAVVLGFTAFVSAAACQGAVSNTNARIVDGFVASDVYAASGWVIFLSFWVMVYQGLAILQLFLHVKLAYKIIPYINWSIFFLVDIIAISIAATGYFCGAISMAVYASRYMNPVTEDIVPPAGAASAFCFLSLFLMIGMIVYFLLAKYVLKWPSHGDSAPAPAADVYAPNE